MITPSHADTAPQQLLRIMDDPANPFHAGSAEPWVANVLAALLRANATRVAVEIGCFEGRTSKVLLNALADLPWPTKLLLCELEPERAAKVADTISDGVKILHSPERVQICVGNSLDWIPTLPDESVDFVWLDGSHEKHHVLQELHLLRSKLAPGGLLCGHDVFGSCDLQEIFALMQLQTGWRSMSLDLPKLGPAGGIGILQKPR